MNNSTIKSPYKVRQDETREVCFDASRDDYLQFKMRFQSHGAVDAACASLFSLFVTSIKAHLPIPTSSEEIASNEARFNQFLATTTFQF